MAHQVFGQFNDSIPPIMDGPVNVVLNYAYWLNKKYGSGYIIGPRVPGQDETNDFHVLRYASLPIPGMSPYRIGLPGIDPLFHKAVGDIEFDLVHAHCPFVSGRLALEIAEKQNIPSITSFHSKYREDFREIFSSNLIVDNVMKNILDFLAKVDYVWVPNRSTGETLREYGYDGEFEVFQNGSDMAAPDEEQYKAYRRKGLDRIGAQDDETILLFVGQHRWVKNIKLLIDGLKVLADRGRKFRMIFVGGGSDTKEIMKTAAQNGIKDQTQFLGVLTDREQLKSIYACTTLFLFPSTYDTSPLVIQEAAAFGVPSVLIKGSSAAEMMIDGENGFTCENRADSFAATIERAIDNDELRRTAGVGARDTIYRSWESIVDTVYARYQEILAQR